MLATKGGLEHVTKSKVGMGKKQHRVLVFKTFKKPNQPNKKKVLPVFKFSFYSCWLMTFPDIQFCSDYQYLLAVDIYEHSEHSDVF